MPWLLQVLFVLAAAGIILWAVAQFPMDATIARLIKVVVVVFVALWLLSLLYSLMVGGGGAWWPMPAPYRRP